MGLVPTYLAACYVFFDFLVNTVYVRESLSKFLIRKMWGLVPIWMLLWLIPSVPENILTPDTYMGLAVINFLYGQEILLHIFQTGALKINYKCTALVISGAN